MVVSTSDEPTLAISLLIVVVICTIPEPTTPRVTVPMLTMPEAVDVESAPTTRKVLGPGSLSVHVI